MTDSYKKTALFFIALMPLLFYAQEDTTSKNKDFWENVRYGGGFGLSMGTDFFSATIAPSAIYEFNDTFALGSGLSFSYNKLDDFYESTIVGASLFGLVNIDDYAQASIEFEESNVSRKYSNLLNTTKDNYWYPSLFLGAGYRSENVTIGIRYDVLYDEEKSIYFDPWMPFVRIYF